MLIGYQRHDVRGPDEVYQRTHGFDWGADVIARDSVGLGLSFECIA